MKVTHNLELGFSSTEGQYLSGTGDGALIT